MHKSALLILGLSLLLAGCTQNSSNTVSNSSINLSVSNPNNVEILPNNSGSNLITGNVIASNNIEFLPNNIYIIEGVINPSVIHIPLGEHLIWNNKDAVAYNLLVERSVMWSKNLVKGERFSIQMNSKGNFTYYIRETPSVKVLVIVE